MNINPLFLVDFYKTEHYRMYPEGMTLLYSNLTPRKSRMGGVNEIVVFGFQYLIKEYLIKQWNENFFNRPKEEVLSEYRRLMKNTIGPVQSEHIGKLHDLGYLPIKIKALPEGSHCPIGVPCMTIYNTHPDHAWLVNYLETLLSSVIWQPITSATIADQYRKLLEKYALETTGNVEGVQWQGHDFSFRGMSSVESAMTSGAGHLLSFTGSDTIPAINFLEKYYNADVEKELVAASVPATEHSVMCMGEKESEIETFKRLLNLYPNGLLSIVSDTWDLWKVCTEYLPALKEQILARDGKLVIRPDSGDPVDIICGRGMGSGSFICKTPEEFQGVSKGVIELLWDVFGGTINAQGYKVLDSHIGAIYGDSITLERAKQICERLKKKGFASTNIVFGIGSYTYQMNTRDTFGFAVKATYGEVLESGVTELQTDGDETQTKKVSCREIFKDPITDDGTKRSKKGLLQVGSDEYGEIGVADQCDWWEEGGGLLETIFENSKLIKEWNLQKIRDNIRK